MLRIALVAGEPSGDILGASLIAAIKQHINEPIVFEGVGGAHMIKAGLKTLFPLSELSVMGLYEVLKHLPRLLKLKTKIITYFTQSKPDIYIGIDAPDFNLPIEKHLKSQHIKTLHVVSPTIWAWRPGRIKTIKKAIHHMLLLFPFEKKYYDTANIPATYIGHPLADAIDITQAATIMHSSAAQANSLNPLKNKASLPQATQQIALLPGSRTSEINAQMPNYITIATNIYKQNNNITFNFVAAHQQAKNLIQSKLQYKKPIFHYKITLANTRQALSQANAALIASGTATLEAMFTQTPTIVTYRLSWLTWLLVKLLVKTPYCAIPNILAGSQLMPEYLQANFTPKAVTKALEKLLNTDHTHYQSQCASLTSTLKQNAAQKAAIVIKAELNKAGVTC